MKPNQILIIAGIVLFLILTFGSGAIGYHFGKKSCPELVSQTTIIEKVYGDTSLKLAVVDTSPKPIESKRSQKKAKVKKQISEIKQKAEAANVDSGCVELKSYIDSLISICDSISAQLPSKNTYDSTVVADSIKTHYRLEVEGKLLSIKIWNANLKPDTKTTITNNLVEKPKPQIYLGAVIGLNNKGTDFVAGPSAAIAYKSFMGNYTYDIKSGSHQVGGYWRVFGK